MGDHKHRVLSLVVAAACLAVLLHAETDYCVGVPSGFLCVEGVTDKFYECNGPFYQGWRDCGAGARCVRVGHFATNPCSAPSGSADGRNATPTPGAPAPAGSAAAEPAGVSWVVWLCVGVASTVVAGAAVGGIVWAARRRRARRSKGRAPQAAEGAADSHPPCSP